MYKQFEVCVTSSPASFLGQIRLFLDEKRWKDAEEHILAIDRVHPAYRDACLLAVAYLVRGGPPSFRLTHYLGPFLGSRPKNDIERAALARYAEHLRAAGDVDEAADVDALLGRRDSTSSPPTALPDLPDLPPLPELPLVPEITPLPEVVGDLMPQLRVGDADRDAATLPAQAGTSTDGGARPPRAADDTDAQKSSSTPGHANSRRGFDTGTVISGRYRIEEKLGTGGMATVFKVFDEELDESVALKVFHMTALSQEADLARFKRELKLARKLRHPNIVQLFDLGTWDGFYYITMELLEGADLHQLIVRRKRRPISPTNTARILRQLFEGLAAAHSKHIVHRDIKPANLFLVKASEELKIMDFGIAKGAGAEAHTQTGMMMGTPQYMAPEQVRDAAHVGPPSDLYAAGVVAYEMLTGQRPFDGPVAIPILMAHVQEPPPPLREANPGIPESLAAFVHRLLEKKPKHRYASAKDALKALDVAMG